MTTTYPGAGGLAVTFRDVVKVYHPDIRALDHVSFDIDRGETVALLGPNGAGKSTAIDTMLGLRAPTSGEVRVLGGQPAAAVAAGRIGGMLQTGGLPSTWTFPEVGARRPSMVSMAVDFPAPFGPSSATVSPRWMSKVTWSSARMSG